MAEVERIDILLVEDNPGDIRLVTGALAETDLNPSVVCVRDGLEAMRYLRCQPPYGYAPRPILVILDLNLPRMDGRAVLSEIKSDPELALIPVILLSGSDAPQDITASYALHANAYIVKPRDLEGMTETIRSLVDFWLKRVCLPPDHCRPSRGPE